ncbi:MAG: hypothetical protein ACJ731_00790 [Vicinamibacterales bacterium]
MEAPEQTTLEFSQVPHIAGVPRYLYRKALSNAAGWIAALLRRDAIGAFDHETWLWFFSGIVRQRWQDSRIRSSSPAGARRVIGG